MCKCLELPFSSVRLLRLIFSLTSSFVTLHVPAMESMPCELKIHSNNLDEVGRK